MTEILQNITMDQVEVVAESFGQYLLGKMAMGILITIFIVMPAWIAISWLKGKVSIRRFRTRLLMQGILSINTYYDINGKEGKMAFIGDEFIRLDRDNGDCHFFGIMSLKSATITRLHIDKSNGKPKK